MKRFKNISFLLIFFGMIHIAQAQYGAQKRGDYFFSQFAYAQAVPEYEKMIEGDLNIEYAHRQLAECYLLLRDFKKAIPHFEMIINDASLPTDYYFKYAMALYTAGERQRSEKWIRKYKKFNKNDSRVKRFLKDGNLASVVFNSRQRYDVEPVSFNSEQSDFGTFVQGDKLYYASSKIGDTEGDIYGWNAEPWLDIFVVQEDNEDSKPTRLKGNVNTKFHESNAVFSTDYKNDTIIYFTRNNYFKKQEAYGAEDEINLKIFSAKQIDGEWIEDRSIRINSDYYSTGHPTVSADRKRMYFTSDRPGGYGGTDIYYSEIHDRGGVGVPVNAGPIINTEGNEMFPFINPEGQLFFSSDGHVGFGQMDIFSTIANEEGEIIDVINLGTPINSSADDFGYYSHEDGITGYISSNREGGIGSDDIYKFKFTPSLDVQGIVVDGINEQPLDSVTIKLFDQKTKTLQMETVTDANGYYRMPINRKGSYRVEASRRTHPTEIQFFNTFDVSSNTRMLERNIVLNPVLDLKLLANLNKIYFDFNKSNIRPDAALELDKVVRVMTKTYPEMIIRLEAHTDPVGSHNYNDGLSERRAKSTYEYLIANGVPKAHILSYKGFGKRKPINHCTSKKDCNAEELELNRRTEFPIIQIKEGILAKAK